MALVNGDGRDVDLSAKANPESPGRPEEDSEPGETSGSSSALSWPVLEMMRALGYRALIAVDTQPWTHSHGRTAMDAQPWTHSHGHTAMDAQPWTHSHGHTAMDTQPWTHSHGHTAMDIESGLVMTKFPLKPSLT
ncbi:hypothetical protein BS47DRAFT_1359158 [Hydnum rufescens UP504]|uniref:Uncharacterized protein n=1 Tax=Hydnum rufescens UP504 TaxID=1448309 RepID=A0A9P6DX52_9AGAM|nr:hypothetical protein BS47DRAFT_1359158 [Hydnum rufescens UP504]